MEQITIFDFVAPEIPDFHNLTEEQIVNVIADAVGLDFKKRDFGRFVAYEAAYKNSVIDVYVSHYTCYDREGEPFILWLLEQEDVIGCEHTRRQFTGGDTVF